MKGFLIIIGESSIYYLREAGRMVLFLFSSLLLSITPPFRIGRILNEIRAIGLRSLIVIFLTASFTGMVLGLQGYYTLRQYGSESLLGSVVALSLIRELGPVLTALMVTGRGGSAMTAEIGIKRITEQIDAMDAMTLDPVKYLVAPKIIAGLITLPLLASIADIIGIYGGYLVGVALLGVNPGSYFYEMERGVVFEDIYTGIIKSITFGLIFTWVCCYKGFYCRHGAEGVSRAITEAVVLSSVLILLWDYFLTSILL
ncbi:MAG: ABC transporter permease [Nitrospirae bacterium]|nr:ABC transporter permease [Nitrospirota bacterium]